MSWWAFKRFKLRWLFTNYIWLLKLIQELYIVVKNWRKYVRSVLYSRIVLSILSCWIEIHLFLYRRNYILSCSLRRPHLIIISWMLLLLKYRLLVLVNSKIRFSWLRIQVATSCIKVFLLCWLNSIWSWTWPDFIRLIWSWTL